METLVFSYCLNLFFCFVLFFVKDLSLFDSAMEFLIGDEKDLEDPDNDEDSESDSFITADSSPACSFGLSQAAMETIPRSFCYRRRHVQASAIGLQPSRFHKLLPYKELESFSPASFYKGHYTLQLRGNVTHTAVPPDMRPEKTKRWIHYFDESWLIFHWTPRSTSLHW